MIDFSDLTPSSDGLVVSVIQDEATGSVRMVGFMDAEALRLTQDTGFVHFWSRTRGRIWKKGETSGNTLKVLSVSVDCDGDALLVTAQPDGPTCHTGADTCFGASRAASLGASLGGTIDRLDRIIATRADADPEVSYTARLISNPDLAARKVLEEAGEVAFARKDLELGGDPSRVIEEAADLLYHLLALVVGCRPRRRGDRGRTPSPDALTPPLPTLGSMRLPPFVVTAFLAVAIGIASCTSSPQGPLPDPPVPTTTEDLLAEITASAPAVVNVWASWCLPCRSEAPLIASASTSRPSVTFIGLNVKDRDPDARVFMAEFLSDAEMTHLSDRSGRIPIDLGGTAGVPLTYFYASDGTLAHLHFGVIDEPTMARYLDEIDR